MQASNGISISIHYGHNATVGLSKDGEVICLLSEERIVRMKNATGFPFKALEYIINTYLAGDPSQIDCLVLCDEKLYGFNYLEKFGYEPHEYLNYYCYTRKKDLDKLMASGKPGLSDKIKSKVRSMFASTDTAKIPIDREKAKEKIAELVGIETAKIHLLNHHVSHALTPLYFGEPKIPQLIFTIDGEGDGLCASVNVFEDGHLKNLSKTPRKFSIGYLYSEVTAYLGMKPNEHEFKVMGMAPYAKPELAERLFDIFKKALWVEEGEFVSDYSMLDINSYLIKNLLYERFDNICGGIQLYTERILVEWIGSWIAKTGINDIALSGGVSMNVKAAKTISEMKEVSSIFVAPSAGDESLVIGGLYHANKNILEKNIVPITHLYLGRSFSDQDIAEYLENTDISSRYNITKYDNLSELESIAAATLENNEVVARCSGKEEWGARALGNRSILCKASDQNNINLINQKVKKRDFWMPFTPSILAEDLPLYIKKPLDIFAPYMSITFESTQKARDQIAASLHPQDSTVRPQELSPDFNEEYYNLIKAYKKRTGISGLLNTSFNLHGEPNVGSPEDAIHTLDNSGLNYLILGSYWIEKKNKDENR